MRLAGRVAHIGKDKPAHRVLVGKPGWTRPLAERRRCWEDDIEVGLAAIGWRGLVGLDLSDSEEKLLAVSCRQGNEPSGTAVCEKFPH